jgi:hypothetical protein
VPSWTVSLETVGADAVDPAGLTALTDALTRVGDVAAHVDGRYLAHVLAPGATANDALRVAMWVWRSALEEAGLPDWPVVRATVEPVTPMPAADPAASRRARRHA